MASTDRPAPSDLKQALAEAPYRYDFFQALRRLEAFYADKPRVGKGLRAIDEGFSLGQLPTMAFAPSTLSSFKPGERGGKDELLVYFFGLFGPNGPLPLHLTEYAYDRSYNESDKTLVKFADIFHHRLLSMFYRAWADAQPTAQHDRPEEDRFALYIGALMGIGMPAFRDRDAVSDKVKLFHAGQFGASVAHPEGLQVILADYFDLPVLIEEFVGEWLPLPAESCWSLGSLEHEVQLGSNSIIGKRVWGGQHKFRVVLGPLSLKQYERFLPGELSLTKLNELIQQYVGLELAWDIEIKIDKEDKPGFSLGQQGRLGWTTWLEGEGQDDDTLVLSSKLAVSSVEI